MAVSFPGDVSISIRVSEFEISSMNLKSLLLINAKAMNSNSNTQNIALTSRREFIVLLNIFE
ncbi:MAG: hypothetical protein QOK88_07600 [Nitrososphaeraceae archaeon]|nr:hypothetical protein [Nitrososphaeraceae archaeon]MDW0139515.1 hypothetical protein [Nitrososphaeraceae archaeon]MDW0156383.1 hypothetical protein [Nitrososphaeraceae archaeon]MDW0156770.1 hypothetical protein [Nitrososphaeraceae archaeon]